MVLTDFRKKSKIWRLRLSSGQISGLACFGRGVT
jgi:hypothetical protein